MAAVPRPAFPEKPRRYIFNPIFNFVNCAFKSIDIAEPVV
jgi:hypothetical protein